MVFKKCQRNCAPERLDEPTAVTVPCSFQSEPEAHFLPLQARIHRVFGWNVKHSNVLRAESLERATTRDIIRLAGDPERRHPVLLRQRNNHAAGSFSVPMATMSGLHCVPNMAGIPDHILIPTHPQADVSGVFAAGKLHFESVCRDTPE